MIKLRNGIVELYKKVATSIPSDVETALKTAYEGENSDLGRRTLGIVLENISLARTSGRPICQDTGFPVFFVKVPIGLSHRLIKQVITEATRLATQKIPLRANSVNTVNEMNPGDNTGADFPMVYIEETDEQTLTIDLMLKGGGSENLGLTYKLPCSFTYGSAVRKAERDLEGVRKCVLDAVQLAQGKGCPPYTIAVAIGGAKDQVSALAKRQMMRKLNDINPDPVLAEMERGLLSEINSLNIGVAGFGGTTTAIGVKIGAAHRHPASYFVDVSFVCWANRRGRLVW